MKQEEENGRQLKLNGQEGEEGNPPSHKATEGREKKRNRAGERKVIFIVLLVTILVSLGFYFVSGRVGLEKKEKIEKNRDFFGSAVYEF